MEVSHRELRREDGWESPPLRKGLTNAAQNTTKINGSVQGDTAGQRLTIDELKPHPTPADLRESIQNS